MRFDFFCSTSLLAGLALEQGNTKADVWWVSQCFATARAGSGTNYRYGFSTCRPFFLSPFSFFLCTFSFLEYEFLSHSLLPSPRPPAVISRLISCQPFPKVRTYAPLLFFHTITSKKTINPGYLLPYVSYFRLTHFTDSFVFHCVFISVCRIDWYIDLFSCTTARMFNKLTYLFTPFPLCHFPVASIGEGLGRTAPGDTMQGWHLNYFLWLNI